MSGKKSKLEDSYQKSKSPIKMNDINIPSSPSPTKKIGNVTMARLAN